MALLSGCAPHTSYDAPLAITRVGDQLVVAICSAGDVARIVVKERDVSVSAEWSTIWRADGATVLPSGSTFTIGDSVEGMVTSIAAPASGAAGHQIQMTVLRSTTDSGAYLLGVFPAIQSTSFDNGAWMQTTGESTPEPCPS